MFFSLNHKWLHPCVSQNCIVKIKNCNQEHKITCAEAEFWWTVPHFVVWVARHIGNWFLKGFSPMTTSKTILNTEITNQNWNTYWQHFNWRITIIQTLKCLCLVREWVITAYAILKGITHFPLSSVQLCACPLRGRVVKSARLWLLSGGEIPDWAPVWAATISSYM